MQNFELTPSMLTMAGVFYPTGYLFLMFPKEEHAKQVAAQLPTKDAKKPTMYLSPDDILNKVVSTVGGANIPLPSVGTEAATIRQYAELASQGHCGLLVHANTAEETEAVMELVRATPFSSAVKYRKLVIEDMGRVAPVSTVVDPTGAV